MTLAARAGPLNSERRDTSVGGTRAVLSSQQLMAASKHPGDAVDQANFDSRIEFRRCPPGERRPDGCSQDMPSRKSMFNFILESGAAPAHRTAPFAANPRSAS